MEEAEKTRKCRRCGRPLPLGSDVLLVQRGIIGQRGVVPVDDGLYFCGDSCLHDSPRVTGQTEIKKRRIP